MKEKKKLLLQQQSPTTFKIILCMPDLRATINPIQIFPVTKYKKKTKKKHTWYNFS